MTILVKIDVTLFHIYIIYQMMMKIIWLSSSDLKFAQRNVKSIFLLRWAKLRCSYFYHQRFLNLLFKRRKVLWQTYDGLEEENDDFWYCENCMFQDKLGQRKQCRPISYCSLIRADKSNLSSVSDADREIQPKGDQIMPEMRFTKFLA